MELVVCKKHKIGHCSSLTPKSHIDINVLDNVIKLDIYSGCSSLSNFNDDQVEACSLLNLDTKKNINVFYDLKDEKYVLNSKRNSYAFDNIPNLLTAVEINCSMNNILEDSTAKASRNRS